MPARVVREEINASESLALVSIGADLMFRALIVAVDDFGRIDARPHYLRTELFRFRSDITDEMVSGWLAELSTASVRDGDTPPVRLYTARDRPYLILTGWERHRGKSHRAKYSKFPDPPATTTASRNIPEDSGTPQNVPEESRRSAREARVVSRETRVVKREGARAASADQDVDVDQAHALTQDDVQAYIEAVTLIRDTALQTPGMRDDLDAIRAGQRQRAEIAELQQVVSRFGVTPAMVLDVVRWATSEPYWRTRLPYAADVAKAWPKLVGQKAGNRSGSGPPNRPPEPQPSKRYRPADVVMAEVLAPSGRPRANPAA